MDLTFQYKSVCSSEGYDKSSELVTNSAATNKCWTNLPHFGNPNPNPKPGFGPDFKPETRVYNLAGFCLLY